MVWYERAEDEQAKEKETERERGGGERGARKTKRKTKTQREHMDLMIWIPPFLFISEKRQTEMMKVMFDM